MDYEKKLATGASPGAIWQAFTDVERWPEMTASIRQVRRLDEGPVREGSQALVSQPGLPRATWTVTRLDPGRSFTWEQSAGGVTTTGEHEISASGATTSVVLRIRQRGRLAGIVGALYGRRIRRFVDMEAHGLAAAAEAAEAGIAR